jgi:hypothetical protein
MLIEISTTKYENTIIKAIDIYYAVRGELVEP